MTTQILNGKVLTPNGWVENGSVLIKDSTISDVLNHSRRVAAADHVIDAEGGYVLPGGIDIHVHGGGGRDFMETDEEAFLTAVKAHRAHGTTSILPTLSSSTTEMIQDAAATCEKLMRDPMNGILGLHLEGPYFNIKMAGAQMPEIIRNPDPKEYIPLVERFSCIRRWDAAPELPGTEEFGRFLRSKSVVAAIAHTAANYEDVERAYEAGFNLGTHFYNAMTSVHKEGIYRRAGTVEAIYLNDGINVEMICDGIHVPPLVLREIYKFKRPERIALITDALACAASDSDTAFDPRVIIEDGVCKLADRSALAGSIATMDRLIRVCVLQAGLPVEDVSRMASETPARIMGVYDRKGSIQQGKDADIMIFDKDINLTNVIQMGREVEVSRDTNC
ncbi:MAG: N-acetylglucosamine-6-phosphate deacetylase [Muribaculaceae bacterium]|nr:N-acetylglucosamine-6-phosphate deacetylase [Muribaculaceae bacterium]